MKTNILEHGSEDGMLGKTGRGNIAVGSQKTRTRRNIQLACAWSAIPLLLMMFIGLWPLAGFIPPLHPWASAAEIAEIYRTQANSIRLGLMMSFFAVMFFFPFGSVIAGQTRRIEGTSTVLSYIQIAAMASSTLIFITPWFCWFTAAFRPERADSEIMLLNDLGWLMFVSSFITYNAWNWSIGVAILTDTRSKPIYPRWLGYYCMLSGVIFLADMCPPFFRKGPFSWEGIFPFYIPFVVFGLWFILMMWYTHRAIMEDPELGAGTDPVGAEKSGIKDGTIPALRERTTT